MPSSLFLLELEFAVEGLDVDPKGLVRSFCFIFAICPEICSEYSCVPSLLILHRSFMASTLLII